MYWPDDELHDTDDVGYVKKTPFLKKFPTFIKHQEGQGGKLDASSAVAAGGKANAGPLGAGRGAGRFGGAPGRFPGGRGGPVPGRGVPISGGMRINPSLFRGCLQCLEPPAVG
jgi:hypothetical protein